MQDIEQALKGNPYPGRGIVVGLTDGGDAFATYFIMGRSVNSRNRFFVQTPDGIRTEAFDPSKMVDPSLIIYSPVRTVGSDLIVTNGDQTDTICDALSSGKSVRCALAQREYEPDAPNYTPRIGAVLHMACPAWYEISILKKTEAGCARHYYTYDSPSRGVGHLIHTYRTDGNPLPAFHGEPAAVSVAGTIKAWSLRVWDALDRDNRVSLYTTVFHTDGSRDSYIINRNN